jgi:hypothetical protein
LKAGPTHPTRGKPANVSVDRIETKFLKNYFDKQLKTRSFSQMMKKSSWGRSIDPLVRVEKSQRAGNDGGKKMSGSIIADITACTQVEAKM